MNSIKMTALRKHPFGTGNREAGEEYEATPDESAILIALGWAEKVEVEKAEAPPAPVEQQPEAIAGKEPVAEPETGKRSYQRRDMKAKG